MFDHDNEGLTSYPSKTEGLIKACNGALKAAKEVKAEYIWLGVWEENNKAIHFYTKNGFIPFDKHIFKLGDEEQTDIMMKLEL